MLSMPWMKPTFCGFGMSRFGMITSTMSLLSVDYWCAGGFSERH